MTIRPLPDLHAECDVAALVYGPGDDPDALLARFLDKRIGEGHDALGVVQDHRPRRLEPRRPPAFRLLPKFEWDAPTITTSDLGDGCRGALADVGRSLTTAVARRPDVVVLNRFGRAEATGSGLLGVVGVAIEAEVPVLIAVPQGLFRTWLGMTGGLAVMIPPSPAGLERWWTSLGHGQAPAQRSISLCARAK